MKKALSILLALLLLMAAAARAEDMDAAEENPGATLPPLNSDWTGVFDSAFQPADPANLEQAAEPEEVAQTAASEGWTCGQCGTENTGRFCTECGAARPEPEEWVCPDCGTANSGKFCTECGAPKPAPAEWTCPGCGTINSGKFCSECGTPRPE